MKNMYFKGSIVAGIGVAIALSGFQWGSAPKYKPRKTDPAQSAEGVMWWYKTMKANQVTGEVAPADYYQAWNQVRKEKNLNKSLGLQWEEMGPWNVGGRTRAILIDKNNPNRMYAGSVTGGLFYSNDGGNTWNIYNAELNNTCISTICQTSNGRIFVGTGSTAEVNLAGNANSSGSVGGGIFEITGNGNFTWIVGPGATPPNNSTSVDWAFVNKLEAYGNRIYAATNKGLRVADPDNNGNYSNWFNPIYVSCTNNFQVTSDCKDVSVASDGTVAAAFGNKIYVSPNGNDNTFCTIYTVSGASRILVEFAPSDPNVLYYSATNTSGCLASIGISLDKGNTFDIIAQGGGSFDPYTLTPTQGGCQGWYDMSMAVYPNDPFKLLVGGIELFRWYKTQNNPVFGQWQKISSWAPQGNFNPYYVHADQHTIVFKDNNTAYFGNDGGVFKSSNLNDLNPTFVSLNFRYATAQFYSLGITNYVNPNNGVDIILGGTQDNGTQVMGLPNVFHPKYGFEISGGDGFDCDGATVSDVLFYTVYFGSLNRSSSSGASGTFFDSELSTACQNGCGPFYTCIRYWDTYYAPNTKDSVQVVLSNNVNPGDTIYYESSTNDIPLYFVATQSYNNGDTIKLPDYVQNKLAFANPIAGTIYLTRQAANFDKNPEWDRIAGSQSIPDAFSGTAVCMEFSKDGNHLFVGTSNGSVYRISNLMNAYDSATSDIRSSSCVLTCTRIGLFSGRAISGIAVDPNNPDNIVVVLGNYGNTNYVYRCINATSAPSSNNTSNFVNITNANLPKCPVYDAEIDMNDKNRIILGTDWGVYACSNGFTAVGPLVDWAPEKTGMGNVPVYEIRQQTLPWAPNAGVIYAATHGRGFFKTGSLVGIKEIEKNITNVEISQLNLFPNPANDVINIKIEGNQNSMAIVQIYDLKGALVKEASFNGLSKGTARMSMNVNELRSGSYIVKVVNGEQTFTRKLLIQH